MLDEPVNGLDPQGIIEMRELILRLNQEKQITFLISSHILDELSRLATHYGFIDNGRIVKEISAEALDAACQKCLRVEVSDTKALARYLDVIRNRTDALRQLTDELFRYSTILSAEPDECPETVDINRVLEESVAAFYAVLHEKGITPQISLPDAKVIRTLNASALSRVFSNILSNAVKYSDGDLEIILSESGEITFSNAAAQLSQVQLGKLFDRFYTVEAARKSTGLGLAIAKTLVLQMHGTINADYQHGRLRILVYFS